jgi:hypothetical protein
MVPVLPDVTVGFVSEILPLPHAEAPSKLSNTALLKLTLAVPAMSRGARVTVPPAGTMMVSGFKSHSEAGGVELPTTTSSVAVYGWNVIGDDHA